MVVNIKNSEIYVWLSNMIFNDLKIKVEEHNKNTKNEVKLNLGIAAYFLNLPEYIGSANKDKYEDGWIPICSEVYKNIKNSSKYFKFLVDIGFFKVHPKNYSTITKTCRRYRLGERYSKQVIKFQAISVNNQFYSKRLIELNDRKERARKKTNHLTKWLDKSHLFSIEYNKAKKHINKVFSNQTRKKKNRTITLDCLENEIVRYSREGKDNRLHSVLTSLPKDLRPFVKYNNKRLASIDITNSQPYIFAIILERLKNKDVEGIFKDYLCENNKDITIMFDLVKNSNRVNEFINEVISGSFYYSFGDKLYKEGFLMTNLNDEYFFTYFKNSKENSGLRIRKFKNRREAAKKVIMRILFCSKSYNDRPMQIFNKYYPEINIILQNLKTSNKSDFPVLLQNIESDFVLDYMALAIL
ncbi:hypothetical protein PL373_13775 [Tenacibaculum maritimum]|nr:hypothetical protein [Tenacibaculum maritimum]